MTCYYGFKSEANNGDRTMINKVKVITEETIPGFEKEVTKAINNGWEINKFDTDAICFVAYLTKLS